MATFIRGNAPRIFLVGLSQLVVNNYAMYDWRYNKIYEVKSSTKRKEEDALMHGFYSIPTIAENSNLPEVAISSGVTQTYEHEEVGAVLKYGRVAKEDDLYGFIGKFPVFMANAMRQTIEASGASLFNNAGTTLGPDGVYLLSVSHPALDGVQANMPSVAVDYSYSAAQDARVNLLKRKSWEGFPIVTPDNLNLVHGPDLDPMVQKLRVGEKEPFSSDNTMNYMQGKFDPIMNPWISDPDAWFITEKPNPFGLIWYFRVRPTMGEFTDNQNGATGIYQRARWSRGITDVRRAILWGCMGA
jgi:hypothetical protein